MRRGGLRRAAWVLVGLLAAVGCREQTVPEMGVVRDAVERGPLKFTVEAGPQQVRFGDPITISLHMHAPEDYEVQLPTAEDLGELEVRDVDSPDPRPGPEGGLDWWRTFTVESFTSGTLEIPPLVAKYARKADAAEEEPAFENELVTGTLKVEVQSALTTQDSPVQPRDITGTLMPERTAWETARGWVIGGAVVIVAAVAAVAVWLLWRRRRREAPPIAAEIWALQMLGRLRAEEVAAGRAREFYYELSEIVRAYIEKKFALAAPEMTTEEFLTALARDRAALPYDAERLRVFLEACDIVKYAAFKPRREDAEQALGTARAFVSQTAAAGDQRLEVGATVSGGQAA